MTPAKHDDLIYDVGMHQGEDTPGQLEIVEGAIVEDNVGGRPSSSSATSIPAFGGPSVHHGMRSVVIPAINFTDRSLLGPLLKTFVFGELLEQAEASGRAEGFRLVAVACDGYTVVPFGDRLVALPLSSFWA